MSGLQTKTIARTPSATATAAGRSAIVTVTTLMICSAVWAVTTLAFLLDAALG